MASQRDVQKSGKEVLVGLALLTLIACGDSLDLQENRLNTLTEDYVVRQTDVLLSQFRCQDAYDLVYPIYNSQRTTRRIRLAMGATYGCFLGVSLQDLITEILAGGGANPGSLFQLMARLFPSTTVPQEDKKLMAAEWGLDALFAALKPGVFVIPTAQVNAGSWNPGSFSYLDRDDLANTYALFLAMGVMGTLENRYGAPNAAGHKTQNLPWTTPASMPGDGCSYVAGLVHFQDTLSFFAQKAQVTSIQVAYTALSTAFKVGMDAACAVGCTACGLVCASCPFGLRDRRQCTGGNADLHSCTGTALIQFVNATW